MDTDSGIDGEAESSEKNLVREWGTSVGVWNVMADEMVAAQPKFVSLQGSTAQLLTLELLKEAVELKGGGDVAAGAGSEPAEPPRWAQVLRLLATAVVVAMHSTTMERRSRYVGSIDSQPAIDFIALVTGASHSTVNDLYVTTPLGDEPVVAAADPTQVASALNLASCAVTIMLKDQTAAKYSAFSEGFDAVLSKLPRLVVDDGVPQEQLNDTDRPMGTNARILLGLCASTIQEIDLDDIETVRSRDWP